MSQIVMSRRNFLKIGAVTATAVIVASCQKSNPYEANLLDLRRPIAEKTDLNEMVRFATLAASGHNTQPWKFALTEKSIEIHPDFTRRLTVVDPNDREMWISLGCALENLVLAAGDAGYECEVAYPGNGQDFIRVGLNPSKVIVDPLFTMIPLRQSTRSEYLDKNVTQDVLAQIHTTTTEDGVAVQFIDGKPALEKVVEYVNAGNLNQYGNKAFVNELIDWLRFNEKEALATRDGLFSKCSGSPTVPHWLGQMFVSGTKPQAQADTDAKKLRSSAGAVVIASSSDDAASWVRCGRVFERLSLNLTRLELKSALLNQPIEVPEIRGQFQSAVGLGSNLPQLLIRYGYADSLPYSLRRPVDEVLAA